MGSRDHDNIFRIQPDLDPQGLKNKEALWRRKLLEGVRRWERDSPNRGGARLDFRIAQQSGKLAATVWLHPAQGSRIIVHTRQKKIFLWNQLGTWRQCFGLGRIYSWSWSWSYPFSLSIFGIFLYLLVPITGTGICNFLFYITVLQYYSSKSSGLKIINTILIYLLFHSWSGSGTIIQDPDPGKSSGSTTLPRGVGTGTVF